MRLAPDTFVLFSFSCELFSCFRGLIGGRGLSSSPLINLSYGRINLKGHQKRGSARAGNASSNVDAVGVYAFSQYKQFIKCLHLSRSKPAPGNLHTSLKDLFLILRICTPRIQVDTSKNHIIITVHGTWPNSNSNITITATVTKAAVHYHCASSSALSTDYVSGSALETKIEPLRFTFCQVMA